MASKPVSVEKALIRRQHDFQERIEMVSQESGVFEARIYFADFQVYSFVRSFSEELFRDGYDILRRFHNWPFPIWGRSDIDKNLKGRPIWYREHPAVVHEFDGYSGRVLIRPENIGQRFPKEPWDESDESDMPMVWVDILSHKIHWIRCVEE